MIENNDVSTLKTLITQVIDTQHRMDGRLGDIEKTLLQLNNAVIGNPTYGQRGMIAELRDVQKYVHRDKMAKSKIMGGLIVIGVGWTMLWEYIKHKLF